MVDEECYDQQTGCTTNKFDAIKQLNAVRLNSQQNKIKISEG